jgi:hypothetical protein
MKSCKEISFLMSQRLDRPLTLAEKAAVQLHRLGCKGCSRYESNLRLIRKACKEAQRLSKE